MAIFDLSRLAYVAGVSLVTARNWTSGRPLRISPSVQVASGRGTRNLYSDSDVYKLAAANRLRSGGMSFRAIGYVLNNVDLERFLPGGDANWLLLRMNGEDIAPQTLLNDELEDELVKLQLSGDRESVHHFVQFSDLLDAVSTRMSTNS